MRNTLKFLLIALYLGIGYPAYLERLAELRGLGIRMTVAYVGLFSILTLSLLLSSFIRHGLLRWTFAVLFAASAAFFDSYGRITADFLLYDGFVSQLYAWGFVDEAFQQFRPSILWASALALLLLTGLGLQPAAAQKTDAKRSHRPSLAAVGFVAAPVAALLLLTSILFIRGGEGARGLPSMFTPLAYLNLVAYEYLTESVGPREPVRLARTGAPVGHDIVLIVDESVSGNYLDINARHGVPTPLKQPPSGVRVYNFGYAASIANCSTDVNVTLRFGGTRSDYARINARLPSIWQYAKAAGLRTVYVDGQRTGRRLQNLMNEWELKEIDEWIQFDGVAVRDRDIAVAGKLAELTADAIPQLIIVNKMGAHFPVNDKFPDTFMHYRPVLPRGGFEEVGDTGSRAGFSGSVADWERYRNSYRNTLLWSVGEFFTRLFATARLDNAVVVYTSDHGQDLHERGNPGLNTHCSTSPVPEEGLVPLVVIEGDKLRTLDWETHLQQNRNRSSHYNVFPTLLQLMGFDIGQTRALYGNPLSVTTDDPFTFNSRFNARLGAKPKWEFIDLDRIMTPSPP